MRRADGPPFGVSCFLFISVGRRPMLLRRGYQFTPGYKLQEYVGKGQFGQVWRASGPGGVTMAVKFVDLSDGRGHKEYEAIKRIKSIRQANLMPITAIWRLDEEGNVIEENDS